MTTLVGLISVLVFLGLGVIAFMYLLKGKA